jgi:hypothetical protein
MRVVIMEPGKLWPRIAHLDDARAIQATLGGLTFARTVHHSGRDFWVVTRVDAEAVGLAPNRIIDGHCLYGPIVVCGYGFADIPLPVAKDLQFDCAWPMAQLESHDKPA